MAEKPTQSVSTEIEFEDPSEEDFEVLDLEDGQEPPVGEKPAEEGAPSGKIELTPEEYKKLLEGPSAINEIKGGMAGIAEALRQPGAPAPMPAAPEPEFDPDAIEDAAYKPKGFVPAVEKVFEKRMTSERVALAGLMQEQSKRLLKINPDTGPLYKRYEKEIEQRIAQLPPQYRVNPSIYDQMFERVRFEHQDEILTERLEARLAEEREKIRAELGLAAPAEKPAAPGPRKPVLAQETSTRTVTAAPKKQLYLTPSDREQMVLEGLDPDDKDQRRSFAERKLRRTTR